LSGLREGAWRLADPRITLASASSMLIGAAAAAADGPLHAGWLAATAAGIFFVETAKNASGEIVDFDSGADAAVAPEDRSPFSGGKRVLVDGVLTRAQVAAVAGVAYALAAAIGIAIAVLREPGVVWLGLAGLVAAFFYHAPPLALSYRGLGELVVAGCYGPLIAAGTYLVQRGSVAPAVFLAAMPLGLAVAAFLVINEFPDFRADRAAGKRNLVVRLGRRGARALFAGLVLAAFAGVALLPALGAPSAVLLGLAGAPFALRAAVRVWNDPEDTRRVVPAQAWTLASFVLLAGGESAGFLLGR
jgi:1,4-dihydroxy-2-naphthoate octaprenyltransferase